MQADPGPRPSQPAARSPHDRGAPPRRWADPTWAAEAVDNQHATTRLFATGPAARRCCPSIDPADTSSNPNRSVVAIC